MRKEYDFSKARRGPVVSAAGKTRITIRLDEDVVEWFRRQVHAAGGGNYQTFINEALRHFVGTREQPIERTVRRVVREELRKVAPRGGKDQGPGDERKAIRGDGPPRAKAS
jgi:hypothetical protein